MQESLSPESHTILPSVVITGRPLGTDKFISKIEVKLGRRLRPLPIGRPKNKTTKVKNKPMKQNEVNINR